MDAKIIVATVCLLATGAFATDYTWNGTNSGNWTDSAMWTPTGYPQTPTDTALFQGLLGTNITITVPSGSAATVAVIRSTMTARNLLLAGSFVMPDGGSIIQDGSTALETVPSATIRMLGSLVLSNNGTRSTELNNAFVGTGTLALIAMSSSLVVANQTGSGISPLFTGEVWIGGRGSTTRNIKFDQPFVLSNSAAFVVKPGGHLNIILDNRTVTLVPPLVLEGNTTLSSGGLSYNMTIVRTCRVSGATNVWNVKNANCRLTFPGMVQGTGVVSLTGNAAGTNSVLGVISPGFGTGTLTLAWSGGVLELGKLGDPVELKIENGDQFRVEGLSNALDISLMDVTFTTLTGADVTNWFLYSGSGFAGGAFHAVNFGPLFGSVVSNDPGMENYIGAVVVPEPFLLTSACGLAMVMFLRIRVKS